MISPNGRHLHSLCSLCSNINSFMVLQMVRFYYTFLKNVRYIIFHYRYYILQMINEDAAVDIVSTCKGSVAPHSSNAGSHRNAKSFANGSFFGSC